MTKKYYKKDKIFYTKEGSSNKQTIVLIHGVSSSSSAWIHYVIKRKEEYSVISIDLRGHGRSFKPKEFSEYSISKFSEDVYGILKKKDYLM